MRLYLFIFLFLNLNLFSLDVEKIMSESQTVNLAFDNDIRSLDPRISNDFPSKHVIGMLFEGLTRINPKGEIVPGIASSYKVSDDKLTYTFYLRDAYWSNGDKITSYDFAYAWRKIVKPDFVTTASFNFYPVKNVKEIIEGKLSLDSIGIITPDSSTIIIKLNNPCPYFLELTSSSVYAPIYEKQDRENKAWGQQENCISNGPFVLEKWKKGNSLKLKKNEKYWDRDNVSLSDIQITIVKDVSTNLMLFEKNQIDWVGSPIFKLPLDSIQSLKQTEELNSHSLFGVSWLFINTEDSILKNTKIRKALSYAIPREQIVEYVLNTDDEPAASLTMGSMKLQDAPYFKYTDIEAARKLFKEGLKELGITIKEFPTITYSFTNREINLRVAQVIQAVWKDLFDVTVDLDPSDWKVHYAKLSSGSYQIGAMDWFSLFSDPIYFLQTFKHKKDAINMSFWENEKYISSLDQAETEIDKEKRQQLLHKAETILFENMPVIPIYFPKTRYLKNAFLKNVYVSPLNEIDLKWAYFEKEKKERKKISDFFQGNDGALVDTNLNKVMGKVRDFAR